MKTGRFGGKLERSIFSGVRTPDWLAILQVNPIHAMPSYENSMVFGIFSK